MAEGTTRNKDDQVLKITDLRIESIHGLDEPLACHLEQILVRLHSGAVAAGECTGERHEPLDQALAEHGVAAPAELLNQLAIAPVADRLTRSIVGGLV